MDTFLFFLLLPTSQTICRKQRRAPSVTLEDNCAKIEAARSQDTALKMHEDWTVEEYHAVHLHNFTEHRTHPCYCKGYVMMRPSDDPVEKLEVIGLFSTSSGCFLVILLLHSDMCEMLCFSVENGT